MSDFLLTENGDIAIVNGDFVRVEGAAAVAQDIAMTLRTWLGESVYDRTAGIPYRQVIFERGTTIEAIRFIIANAIQNVPHVTEILQLDPVLNRATRTLTMTGRVRIDTGEEVTFSEGASL